MGRKRDVKKSGGAALLCLGLGLLTGSAGADDLGLRLPQGFRVTLYADETLANDIQAMTLDASGRVVVTGRGYVKTLHESQGSGRADRATLFAETRTGGMGLCFDGNSLLFCGDGWLSRYLDQDGDGRADGAPERIVPLKFAEHGGHAMRQGPDGYWYVIAGNEAEVDRRLVTSPDSPIRDPEAGTILRFPPSLDPKRCEVVAQGFRNPYDFDFNPAGDLLTYDSDCERDAFLPWYSPTRIYHVAHAGHHGWRLDGFQRSWARPDYDLDTVDILWPVGRGSPTGVVCYRHDQFPEHYRNGVFALDWTFGKIYYFPLRSQGASYRTEAEVFLEPTGTQGFAPTDAAVAPDGSLYVCIGGRRTRGAVYRIEYISDDRTKAERNEAKRDVKSILNAHQPFDAWARNIWVPEARKLGRERFLEAVIDESFEVSGRVRAVEIITELFGGLTQESALAGSRSRSAEVRARVAWSLGRRPLPGFAEVLSRLAEDDDPRVRLHALEALADQTVDADPNRLERSARINLGHLDKRVRQAAAHLAVELPMKFWKQRKKELEGEPPLSRLMLAVADVQRQPEMPIHDEAAEVGLSVLGATVDPSLRLQAVRLIMLALGDYHLNNPPVEIDTGYSLAQSLKGRDDLVNRVTKAVREFFPSRNPELDDESSRLLAMLEDDDTELPKKVASFWTDASSPTRDMHYLIVYSRLRGTEGGSLTRTVANTILALDRKLQGQEQRIKQSWNDRLSEVVTRLLRRDARLGEAMLDHPDFVSPNHVSLASAFTGESRDRAARLYLARVRADADFAWSGPLVDLLATLPDGEARPVFREHWDEFGLRDVLVLRLAESPDPLDREKFLWGLESSQPQVIRASLSALEGLPRDPAGETLVPVLRLLRRLLLEPNESALRTRTLALAGRQGGETFKVAEAGTDAMALRRAYGPVLDWFERVHPALAGALGASGEEDLASWRERLKSVEWDRGVANRGEALFRARACETCHAGPRALGPDLTGVTGRFSRDDLIAAIVAPSLDVSPLYRTTLVETRDGQIHSGMVAFESADGLILQTGATTTVRVATPDIVSRIPGNRSLMPAGLLKDLKPDELADLYAFLRNLSPRPGADKPASKSKQN